MRPVLGCGSRAKTCHTMQIPALSVPYVGRNSSKQVTFIAAEIRKKVTDDPDYRRQDSSIAQASRILRRSRPRH